jgi:hypothetical protein
MLELWKQLPNFWTQIIIACDAVMAISLLSLAAILHYLRVRHRVGYSLGGGLFDGFASIYAIFGLYLLAHMVAYFVGDLIVIRTALAILSAINAVAVLTMSVKRTLALMTIKGVHQAFDRHQTDMRAILNEMEKPHEPATTRRVSGRESVSLR